MRFLALDPRSPEWKIGDRLQLAFVVIQRDGDIPLRGCKTWFGMCSRHGKREKESKKPSELVHFVGWLIVTLADPVSSPASEVT